jgi:hypothetical protein
MILKEFQRVIVGNRVQLAPKFNSISISQKIRHYDYREGRIYKGPLNNTVVTLRCQYAETKG